MAITFPFDYRLVHELIEWKNEDHSNGRFSLRIS